MITASVVTYDHHLLDIEPVLRSLFASPVDIVYVIDQSENMLDLKQELLTYANKVLKGEPELREKLNKGFQLLYFPHENLGYGSGHNFAIRMAIEAGSTYHLVVNPDIWFGPEVFPTILSYMKQHPEVGQIMPRVLYPKGNEQRLVKLLPAPFDVFARLCLPERLFNQRNSTFELRHSNYSYSINAPYLSGCFMFFDTKALQEVGLFDEHFFMYAEDIDLTRRMHRKYQTLFFPQAIIYHKFSRASHRSFRLFRIHVLNLIMYFNKWGWWSDPERDEFNRRCLADIDECNSRLGQL
ncbi:MAG: glycosyltransferase family 2 protein [Bacteroidales bacterium]|jgi:hypothetical protein|nr:glycosyltransferase family 2 protein [Bacteroidales bacterium]